MDLLILNMYNNSMRNWITNYKYKLLLFYFGTHRFLFLFLEPRAGEFC